MADRRRKVVGNLYSSNPPVLNATGSKPGGVKPLLPLDDTMELKNIRGPYGMRIVIHLDCLRRRRHG